MQMLNTVVVLKLLTRWGGTAAFVDDVEVFVSSSAWVTEEAVVCRNSALVLVLTTFNDFLSSVEVDAVHAVVV